MMTSVLSAVFSAARVGVLLTDESEFRQLSHAFALVQNSLPLIVYGVRTVGRLTAQSHIAALEQVPFHPTARLRWLHCTERERERAVRKGS